MCLRIKVELPDYVLAEGNHAGHDWIVTHNGCGFRCGYVRVPLGHPWHGKHYDDVNASVHGGLTFSEPDVACGHGGEDNAYWFGFDCAHYDDAQDRSLPNHDRIRMWEGGDVRTQEYVEAECRKLCEQAAAATSL